tara:strand:+ start:892 stop:1227 length:336 start_codon:yes stop_codon:yes gene_type:complete
MTNSDLEAINVKLDKVLELLQQGEGHQLIPSYTGSRKLDYILEEAYANNESVDVVLKRHNRSTKSKVGKDLDRLDDVLRENAEKAVEKTPVFNTSTKYYEEWDGVHDSEGC